MVFGSIREAAEAWVQEFNAVPHGIIDKLLQLDCDEITEITGFKVEDQVYVFTHEATGEVVEKQKDPDDNEMVYEVDIGNGEKITCLADEMCHDDPEYGCLPMHFCLWSFGNTLDNYWLEQKGGLELMTDCGFRIYRQEDYGYIFGIDGLGYDFYEDHWIPLYMARGLKWAECQKA